VFDCLGGNTPPPRPERNTAWNKGRKCFHCVGAPNNLIRPWWVASAVHSTATAVLERAPQTALRASVVLRLSGAATVFWGYQRHCAGCRNSATVLCGPHMHCTGPSLQSSACYSATLWTRMGKWSSHFMILRLDPSKSRTAVARHVTDDLGSSVNFDLTVWHLEKPPLLYHWKQGPLSAEKWGQAFEMWLADLTDEIAGKVTWEMQQTKQLITETALRSASVNLSFPSTKIKKKWVSQKALRTEGCDAV